MQPVLSREQIRAFDRHAIEHCSVRGVVLMENAGRGAAEVLLQRYAPLAGPVLIVCGRGNNGGDGFVIARHLAGLGLPVEVVLLGDPDRILSRGHGHGVSPQTERFVRTGRDSPKA